MRNPHRKYLGKPPRNEINLQTECLNLIQTALDDETQLSIRREIKCENPFHNFVDLATWLISIEGVYIACFNTRCATIFHEISKSLMVKHEIENRFNFWGQHCFHRWPGTIRCFSICKRSDGQGVPYITITSTKDDFLSIGPLGTNFNENWIEIQNFFIHENFIWKCRLRNGGHFVQGEIS